MEWHAADGTVISEAEWNAQAEQRRRERVETPGAAGRRRARRPDAIRGQPRTTAAGRRPPSATEAGH